MTRAVIQADFWHDQLEVNASQAIFHQWQQLEASGCINNFRIKNDALALFDLLKGGIYAKRRPVRTMGRHCLYHIGD